MLDADKSSLLPQMCFCLDSVDKVMEDKTLSEDLKLQRLYKLVAASHAQPGTQSAWGRAPSQQARQSIAAYAQSEPISLQRLPDPQSLPIIAVNEESLEDLEKKRRKLELEREIKKLEEQAFQRNQDLEAIPEANETREPKNPVSKSAMALKQEFEPVLISP